MPTPPTGTRTPTRPERLALFDRDEYRESDIERVERIRRGLGFEADLFDKDATEAALDVVAHWLAPRWRDVNVVTRVLVSMHGTGVTDVSNVELARRCGPKMTRQHASDAVSRAVKLELLEVVNAGGGSASRLLAHGSMLRLNEQLRATAQAPPGDAEGPAKLSTPVPVSGYTPTRQWVGGASDTSLMEIKDHGHGNQAQTVGFGSGTLKYRHPTGTCETCRAPVRTGLDGVTADPWCEHCYNARKARRAPAAPDRGSEHCTGCGAANRTNNAGQFVNPCDACHAKAVGSDTAQ